MKQSYPTGFVAEGMRRPLTYENYQGRLLVSEIAHVVMPNEQLMCGVCRNEIFTKAAAQTSWTCWGVDYKRRVHSYVIEAKVSE